jgi:hypothetical protein
MGDGSPVKLAFGLMFHDAPAQAAMLVRDIYNPIDDFAIHVDRDSTDFMKIFREHLPSSFCKHKNVSFIDRRPVIWGSWDIAQVELDLISFLLEKSLDWTHFINLSGRCFPLVRRVDIMSELSSSSLKNYVEVSPIADFPDNWNQTRYSYRISRKEINCIGPKQTRDDIRWVGANWHVLTRRFCQFLTSAAWNDVSDYLRDTLCPDEKFVQHVVMSAGFRETVSNARHYTKWQPYASHPDELTDLDFQSFMSSGAFFARKFDFNSAPELLNRIRSTRGSFW